MNVHFRYKKSSGVRETLGDLLRHYVDGRRYGDTNVCRRRETVLEGRWILWPTVSLGR